MTNIHLILGVGAVLANSRCTSPAPSWGRRTPKPREHSPEVNIPGPQDTELLIMGIIRDKKEEKFHEAHHVRDYWYFFLHKLVTFVVRKRAHP